MRAKQHQACRALLSKSLSLVGVLVVGWFAVACQDDPVVTPTRYLERPNSIDFFCVGLVSSDGTAISGLPAYACDSTEPGAENRALFGLVTNSARSEAAMVDISRGALIDLANHNPGFGFVPVGEMPLQVRVSEDGCAGYVVNHSSCDLSVIDINGVLASAGYPVLPRQPPNAPTARLAVRTATGRLLVRPLDLALRREFLASPPPVGHCGEITGHRAYVSLPACGLVAEVDLSSGRILQSLQFSGGGVQSGGINPTCPSECVDFAGDGVGGGSISDDRPGPLLVTHDGLRLVIGSVTHPHVTIVDIDATTGQFANARMVALAEEERGVRQVRQSPYTRQNDLYFFYVVARSGVIHVLDADFEWECETNPDPADTIDATTPEDVFFPGDRLADTRWEAFKGCLPLHDPATPRRAPGIETPGIVLPGERVAVDVAFVELDHSGFADTTIESLDPRFIGGTFAYAVSMDGLAYLINVDEIYPTQLDPGSVDVPLDHRRRDGLHALLGHQLRNRVYTAEEEGGRPRAADDETQTLTLDEEIISDEVHANHDRVRVVSGGSEPNISIVDPYRIQSEQWSLSYMGTLPQASRSTGQVIRADLSGLGPDEAEFRDPGIGMCQAGVRDQDVLKLFGCASSSDCGLGFYCFRSFSQAPDARGICLASDASQALEEACEPLAISLREYEVQWAADDHLIVVPRVLTGMQACSDEFLNGFCCDAEDEPVGILRGEDCLAGPLPDAAFEVTLDDGSGVRTASCFEGFVLYELWIGEQQYLLSGSRTGALVSGVPDLSNGNHCMADPDQDPAITARVPRSEEPFRNAVLSLQLSLPTGASAVTPTHGYRITFEMVAGFEAWGVDVSARLPAVVQSAPDGNLYVIDQGDENLAGGLQGQVLRLLPGDIALDTSFVVR